MAELRCSLSLDLFASVAWCKDYDLVPDRPCVGRTRVWKLEAFLSLRAKRWEA